MAAETQVEPPQPSISTTLSGVARVLVNAGKLSAKAAEELSKSARERKANFVATVVGANAVKPDEIGSLLDIELHAMEEEHHAPVVALTKTADGLPGFGIVAAVLGIVVTMEHISGPVEEVGHHVGAALVGTMLGILLSYGFFAPLAAKMEVLGHAESLYFRTLAAVMQGFFSGMQPKMAIESGRRGLGRDVRPEQEAMEKLLKAIDTGNAS